MSEKRPANIVVASAPKKSRKSVNLKVKLDVLRRYDVGERPSEIARVLKLPDSTVRTIKVNEKKIRECAQSVTPLSASRINKSRDKVMDNMERLLDVWIEDQAQKHIPLSLIMIQQKAKSLFEALKTQYGDSSTLQTFTASRGWFQRFKRRSSLHHIKVTGETSNVDSEIAKRYSLNLKALIEESGYTPHHVFNMGETGLYWKWMPSHTYIAKEEKTTPGFKVARNDLDLKKSEPEIQREIVALAKNVGDEVDESDVEEPLQADSDGMSNQESVQHEQAEEKDVVLQPSKNLSTKHLSDLFSLLNEAKGIVAENDPNMERSCAFIKGLEILSHCYKELYNDKKKKALR